MRPEAVRRRIAGMVLAAALLPVHAGEAAGPRFEATPFAAYRVGGDFRAAPGVALADPEDGSGWGLSLGLYRDPHGFYELLYSRREAGLRNGGAPAGAADLRIEYLHFGGTLLFPQPRGEVGYVSATLGLTRLDATAGGYASERKFSASFGGGFRFPLTDRLHATLGVRGYLTFVDQDTGLVCVSIEGEAGCLVSASGSTFWELEGLAGLSFRF